MFCKDLKRSTFLLFRDWKSIFYATWGESDDLLVYMGTKELFVAGLFIVL